MWSLLLHGILVTRPQPATATLNPTFTRRAYNCRGPIDALVDLAAGRDVPNASPGELGARVVEIIDALYRSARSHTPVAVP